MSARPSASSTWASASISAASVPGRGAIHSARASAGVSSRSGLTETNRQPRARAALTQPRALCRETPPGDTAAFFGDSPPKATTSPLCSATTDLAVAWLSSTFASAITWGSSTVEVPRL